jgi:hypothetical protein
MKKIKVINTPVRNKDRFQLLLEEHVNLGWEIIASTLNSMGFYAVLQKDD